MANAHIPQQIIKAAGTSNAEKHPGIAHALARVGVADGTISAWDIVYESGESNGKTKFKRASSAAAATATAPLYVALGASTDGDKIEVHPGPLTVPLDTTGSGLTSQGNTVYLGTAGAKQGTAGTIIQRLGVVRKANSATGDFTFVGSMASNTVSSGSGIPDGTAAAPGLPYLTDTDTGFFHGVANAISMALGGVAGLIIATGSPTFAAATDTVGQDVFIRSPTAGGTATAARVGGKLDLGAGGGSAGSTTIAGGVGGAMVVAGGAGGAKAGTGAAAGGAGGVASLTGGPGGNTASSGTDAGGAGAKATVAGGTGGNATAGTGNGGVGGDVDLVPGTGGTSAGGTAGAKGRVKVNGTDMSFDMSTRYLSTSVDHRIFTANRAYRVVGIRGTVDIAGTDGGAVTAVLRKVPSGTAITSGNLLNSGTYNLKGTLDTVQSLTLSSTDADLLLVAGDSVAVDFSGTLTSAQGCISVAVLPV